MKFIMFLFTFILTFTAHTSESFLNVWKKKNIAYKVRPGESIKSILKKLGHIKNSDDHATLNSKVMQVIWRNGLYSQNVKEGDILWLTPGEMNTNARDVANENDLTFVLPNEKFQDDLYLKYWSNSFSNNDYKPLIFDDLIMNNDSIKIFRSIASELEQTPIKAGKKKPIMTSSGKRVFYTIR